MVICIISLPTHMLQYLGHLRRHYKSLTPTRFNFNPRPDITNTRVGLTQHATISGFSFRSTFFALHVSSTNTQVFPSSGVLRDLQGLLQGRVPIITIAIHVKRNTRRRTIFQVSGLVLDITLLSFRRVSHLRSFTHRLVHIIRVPYNMLTTFRDNTRHLQRRNMECILFNRMPFTHNIRPHLRINSTFARFNSRVTLLPHPFSVSHAKRRPSRHVLRYNQGLRQVIIIVTTHRHARQHRNRRRRYRLFRGASRGKLSAGYQCQSSKA